MHNPFMSAAVKHKVHPASVVHTFMFAAHGCVPLFHVSIGATHWHPTSKSARAHKLVLLTFLSTFVTCFEAFNVANTQKLLTFATSFMFQLVPLKWHPNSKSPQAHKSVLLTFPSTFATHFEAYHVANTQNLSTFVTCEK